MSNKTKMKKEIKFFLKQVRLGKINVSDEKKEQLIKQTRNFWKGKRGKQGSKHE